MPLTPSAGVTVNDEPLQIVTGIFTIAGRAFTVTVSVKDEPGHPPVIGVTVNVAV
jgi:hypothetical protein